MNCFDIFLYLSQLFRGGFATLPGYIEPVYFPCPVSRSSREEAGIIAGTVIVGLIALVGAAWPFIQPMVQQYLPF